MTPDRPLAEAVSAVRKRAPVGCSRADIRRFAAVDAGNPRFVTIGQSARTSPRTARSEDRGLLAREVVRIYKAFAGRGPTRAAVHRLPEGQLICILREVLMPAETVLLDRGRAELVVEVRDAMHASMLEALTAAGERATGRKVLGVTLVFDAGANSAAEVFRFEDTCAKTKIRGAGCDDGH